MSLLKKKRKNKEHIEKPDQESKDRVLFSRRVFVSLLLMLAGISALIYRVFYLQVTNYSYYKTESNNNRVRSEVIPPVRGNIFDRNGTALSENILSYDLIANLSQAKNVESSLANLPNYIRFDEEDLKQYYDNRNKVNSYQNFVVRTDLSEEEISQFLVNLYQFPGFNVVPSFKRFYPHGNLTAHVVGYINNINKRDLEKITDRQYEGTDKIGRTGIEAIYEKRLHGKAGYRQVEKTSTGEVVRVIESIDPIPGEDLHLTLDLRLQKIITDELEAKGFDGAGVALDPNNGEVLALVSNPGFDANLFVDGISHKDYDILRNSPRKNLFNRALQGRYPPASTIKPVMALTALNYYETTLDMKVDCPGSYQIPDYKGTKRFFCWKRSGHGELAVRGAIEQSCDVYFYTMGQALGVDRIHSYLLNFGLGEKTGIDLPNESTGILPSKAWKTKRYKKQWFVGDTINLSIGQGYMLCTPLQIANYTSIIANKGHFYQPHLLKSYLSPSTQETVNVEYGAPVQVTEKNVRAWDEIRESLYGVMNSRKGTGFKHRPDLNFNIAGKTGTAQVFSFKNNKRIKQDDLKHHLRDNSVFITYAPAKNPKISLAIMAENSGGSEDSAITMAATILEKYFAPPPKKEEKPA